MLCLLIIVFFNVQCFKKKSDRKIEISKNENLIYFALLRPVPLFEEINSRSKILAYCPAGTIGSYNVQFIVPNNSKDWQLDGTEHFIAFQCSEKKGYMQRKPLDYQSDGVYFITADSIDKFPIDFEKLIELALFDRKFNGEYLYTSDNLDEFGRQTTIWATLYAEANFLAPKIKIETVGFIDKNHMTSLRTFDIEKIENETYYLHDEQGKIKMSKKNYPSIEIEGEIGFLLPQNQKKLILYKKEYVHCLILTNERVKFFECRH